MMVPTELRCPSLWGAPSFKIELPLLGEGTVIYLKFTISWFGEIEGDFEIQEVTHYYGAHTGYIQKIRVKPL